MHRIDRGGYPEAVHRVAYLVAQKGKPLPPVGNYDVAYTDPGSRVISIGGELRSSWVVYPENGKIPALTPEGKKIQSSSPQRIGSGYDNPEERGLGERCVLMSGGPPLRSGLYNNNVQIVQTPEHVMMMVEMIHDVRVIPIVKSAAEAKHGPNEIPRWGGDSVGWYEGDTLVVHTINSHPKQRSYITTKGQVTERYTRWSDDEIFYEFKVEDPTLYTESWGGEQSLRVSKEPLYEYACHEGNYSMFNLLSGARAYEREGRKNGARKAIFAGVAEADE